MFVAPRTIQSNAVTALSKVVNEASDDWDEHIDAVAFAYRIKVQATTRKSPFELLYVRRHCQIAAAT